MYPRAIAHLSWEGLYLCKTKIRKRFNNMSRLLCVSNMKIELSDLRDPIFMRSDVTDIILPLSTRTFKYTFESALRMASCFLKISVFSKHW